MKITKSRLQQIIKEELFSEAGSWKSSWRDNKKGVRLPKKPDLYPENELNIKTAQTIFKYFHLSSKKLGKETFVFNPRIPRGPMDWEDDFTKRVSLAPTIKKAVEALYSETGEDFYVYAGDVENDATDDIETISVKAHYSKCPKSKKNPYNDDFSVADWLVTLPDDELSPLFRKIGIKKQHYPMFKLMIKQNSPMSAHLPGYKEDKKTMASWRRDRRTAQDYNNLSMLYKRLKAGLQWGDFSSPKQLPKKIRDKFQMCVPDARKTNEFWAIKTVELIYLGQHKAGDTFVELSDSAKIYLGALFNKKK